MAYRCEDCLFPACVCFDDSGKDTTEKGLNDYIFDIGTVSCIKTMVDTGADYHIYYILEKLIDSFKMNKINWLNQNNEVLRKKLLSAFPSDYHETISNLISIIFKWKNEIKIKIDKANLMYESFLKLFPNFRSEYDMSYIYNDKRYEVQQFSTTLKSMNIQKIDNIKHTIFIKYLIPDKNVRDMLDLLYSLEYIF